MGDIAFGMHNCRFYHRNKLTECPKRPVVICYIPSPMFTMRILWYICDFNASTDPVHREDCYAMVSSSAMTVIFIQHSHTAGDSTEKYTLILESFLLDNHSLTLKKDAFRLGERLRRECPVITKKLKSAGGNKRHALLNKNFCLNRRNELITFADMTETQTKLADVHEQLDLASETILDIGNQCFEPAFRNKNIERID